jgi:type I restriction enzyme M protein
MPYSPGTKTNVIFFTKGYKTETMWLYDGRSNVPHITKTGRPLTSEHFAEFGKCFGTDPNGRAKRKPTDSKEDRWRKFSIDEVEGRDFKIDSLKWLKDESLDATDDLIDPEELATDAIAELEAAVEELKAMVMMFESNANENGEAAELVAADKKA